MRIKGILSNLKHNLKIRKLRKKGMKIGDNCFILSSIGSFGSEPYLIEIGDRVLISAHCFICAHDGGTWTINNLNNTKYDKIGKIIIGNNVYIGYGVSIFGNVRIGNNVIIGANSVVTKNLLENSVYAGVPARRICSIDEYIEKNRSKFDETYLLNYKEKKDYFEKKYSISK